MKAEKTPKLRRHRRSLTHIGSLCVLTEAATNPPICLAGLIIDKPISREDWKERITERLLNNPHFFRLRSRVDDQLRNFEQVDMDLDDHVIERSIKCPISEEEEELRDIISEYMSLPLSIEKPMWQTILVDGYSKGFIVLFRCHHVIGDGTSIALICQKLCDGDTVERKLEEMRRSMEMQVEKDKQTLWGRIKHHRLFKIVSIAVFFMFLWIGCLRLMFKWFVETILKGLDPPTRMNNCKVSEGGEKRVAFSCNQMSVEDAKLIGKPFRATVNDVMLNCLASSIDRYHKVKGDEVKRMNIRVGIPVNIRRTLEDFKMPSNKFGFMVCNLPLGVTKSSDRLSWIRDETHHNKQLPESLLTNFLNFVMGLVLPVVLLKWASKFVSKFQSVVCSNVAAVAEQCSIKGSNVVGILPFTPLPYGIGLGLMILSYNGSINIAITSDKKLIPDPELLIQFFVDEFRHLQSASQNICSSA